MAGGAGPARRRRRRDRRLQEPDRSGRRAAPGEHRVRRAVPRGGATGWPARGWSRRTQARGTRPRVVGLTRKPLPEAVTVSGRSRAAARGRRTCGHDPGARRLGEERAEDDRPGDRALRPLPSPPSAGSSTAVQLRLAAPPARHERVTAAFLDRFEHRFVLAHVKDVGPDGAECRHPPSALASSRRRPTSRSCGNAVPTCG